MRKHPNNAWLSNWLLSTGHDLHARREHFDDHIQDEEFAKHRDQLQEQHPEMFREHLDDLARLWCLAKHEDASSPSSLPAPANLPFCRCSPLPKWVQIAFGLLVILLLSKIAFGQAVAVGQGVGGLNRGDDSFVTIQTDCPNCAGPITIQSPVSATGQLWYLSSTSGTLAATPTDIAVLPGNATNTVVVTGVNVTCVQGTTGIAGILLIKRSTADSGGASSAMTVLPVDSNNAAGVSVPLFYTANPTLGVQVAVADQKKMMIPAVTNTTPTANDSYVWSSSIGQSIVLRGVAQQLAVNFGAQSIGGAACAVNFKWIETTLF